MKIKPKHVSVLHHAHEATHLAYFAAVFIESHGIYGNFAGGLFAFGLVAVLFRVEL